MKGATGREQIVPYRDGQIATLQVVPGTRLTVGFDSGEKVQNLRVSDPAIWYVKTNRANSRLFIETSQVQGGGVMTVLTNRHSYTLSLTPAANDNGAKYPSTVRLRYSSFFASPNTSMSSTASSIGAPPARYQIRGDLALRPSSVSDDGVRTFIDWPTDVSLPAVYTVDAAGHEGLTNGNMRDGRFVIDSVEKHLVFRLDKRVATAVRVLQQSAR